MHQGLLTATVALALVLPGADPVWAQVGPSAEVDEPRAFGYMVGDLVQRHVRLQAPAGLVLDPSSLPRAGRRGQALELRRVELGAPDADHGQRLLLEYQVFLAPPEVRTLEMPPLRLRFDGPQGERDLRIDAWPVTVAPLVPVDVSPRRGLGEMQPDAAPLPIDTAAPRWRLALYAGLLLLAAGYLAQVYFGLPWWARRHRPFAQAWRRLQALPPQPSATQRREAFEQLHVALNRSAGGAMFESGVDRFIEANPRFGPLRRDLRGFFRHSQEQFFAGNARADEDWAWLRSLARRCRDAERGSA